MDQVMPVELHDRIARAAYVRRGFGAEEAAAAARCCQTATWHGIKSHNLIKALHLDELLGSLNAHDRGCIPGAEIVKQPCRFDAAQIWDANKKLGPAVAFEAMDVCMELADRYGVGMVSVDRAFHYLWGGGYVIEAAKRGYIAYTNCTAAKAEVVPFGGSHPTLGTNPHTWGFPTVEAVGFPIVVDWATSVVAMGRVQQFAREGIELPPGAAVDKDGRATTDPAQVAALLPFGAHKGYGLALIDELVGAFIGGSLPTLRSQPQRTGPGEKTTCNFFFQVIHPDALNAGAFACRRDQAGNVAAVIADILGHGNAPPQGKAILPGQLEHNAAVRSEEAAGLLFSPAEIEQLHHIGAEVGVSFDPAALKTVA
jgi:LDH2 family malate/lactate/ureidoglycolate dehydrogenase